MSFLFPCALQSMYNEQCTLGTKECLQSKENKSVAGNLWISCPAKSLEMHRIAKYIHIPTPTYIHADSLELKVAFGIAFRTLINVFTFLKHLKPGMTCRCIQQRQLNAIQFIEIS